MTWGKVAAKTIFRFQRMGAFVYNLHWTTSDIPVKNNTSLIGRILGHFGLLDLRLMVINEF